MTTTFTPTDFLPFKPEVEVEVDRTAALQLRRHGLVTAFGNFVFLYIALGFGCGAAAGTLILPVFGTAAGAVIGGIAGVAMSVPLALVFVAVLAIHRRSAYGALRWSMVICALVAAIGGMVACVLIQWQGLPAVIAASFAAAYASDDALLRAVTPEQRLQFEQGVFGWRPASKHLAIATIASPVVFWLAVFVSAPFF